MGYTTSNIKPSVDQAFSEIVSKILLSTLAPLCLWVAKEGIDSVGVANGVTNEVTNEVSNDGLTTHQEIGYLANAFATDPATY